MTAALVGLIVFCLAVILAALLNTGGK